MGTDVEILEGWGIVIPKKTWNAIVERWLRSRLDMTKVEAVQRQVARDAKREERDMYPTSRSKSLMPWLRKSIPSNTQISECKLSRPPWGKAHPDPSLHIAPPAAGLHASLSGVVDPDSLLLVPASRGRKRTLLDRFLCVDPSNKKQKLPNRMRVPQTPQEEEDDDCDKSGSRTFFLAADLGEDQMERVPLWALQYWETHLEKYQRRDEEFDFCLASHSSYNGRDKKDCYFFAFDVEERGAYKIGGSTAGLCDTMDGESGLIGGAALPSALALRMPGHCDDYDSGNYGNGHECDAFVRVLCDTKHPAMRLLANLLSKKSSDADYYSSDQDSNTVRSLFSNWMFWHLC